MRTSFPRWGTSLRNVIWVWLSTRIGEIQDTAFCPSTFSHFDFLPFWPFTFRLSASSTFYPLVLRPLTFCPFTIYLSTFYPGTVIWRPLSFGWRPFHGLQPQCHFQRYTHVDGRGGLRPDHWTLGCVGGASAEGATAGPTTGKPAELQQPKRTMLPSHQMTTPEGNLPTRMTRAIANRRGRCSAEPDGQRHQRPRR